MFCLTEVLPAQQTIVHPTAPNLRTEGGAVRALRTQRTSKNVDLERFAARIRSARRIDSIGTVDGDERLAFGRIQDVGVNRFGRLAVLDYSNMEVRLLGPDGTPSARFGRRGGGPTEFRNPVAVWWDADDRITVVDGVFGAKRFTLSANGPVVLSKRLEVITGATGACGDGSQVVLYAPILANAARGATASRVVHRFDSTGNLLRSIGDAYKTDVPLVRSDMSEGIVACAPSGASVYALSKLPFIHLLDGRGGPRWSVRFDDYTVGRVTEEINSTGRRSIGLDPDRPDFSLIRRMTVLNEQFVLVQIAHSSIASLRRRQEWGALDTYVTHLASGETVFVGDHLPMLTGAFGGVLIGFENDPYPRIVRLQLLRP
jgi:hypothetical protein